MAPSRTRRTTPDPAPPNPAQLVPRSPATMLDLDGGSSGVHHLLTQAVEEAARLLEADGAMVDLLMPNMDGITAIGRIKAERPETEIVTMTSFIEEEKVTAALEAGASGYVLKDAEADEVAAAVRAAFAGEVHLDPAVARLLAQRLRAKKSPDDDLAEPLTDREKDVMRLLGQGMSNKEIGSALSSRSGPRGPTSPTPWASSASPRAPRRPSTPWSTSWWTP